MKTKLLASTAAAVLIAFPGLGLAQQAPTGGETGQQQMERSPGETQPGAPGAAETRQPGQTGQTEAPGAAADDNPLAGMMAEDIVGMDIEDAQGESIGTVDDVVMGPDGEPQSVVVDIGGFLGIGARTVAIPVEELERRADTLVAPDLTREQAENLPEHRDDAAPGQAPGAPGGGTTR